MSGCASIFRLSPIETKEEDVAKKLLNSMRVTSACRFNASNRLEWQGKMSFVLTTILSLGLILIPLLQNSGVELRFEERGLNAVQIFLAVSVLVYSAIIGKSRFETRSYLLDRCGNDIKDLARKLRTDISEKERSGGSVDLRRYHEDYRVITTSCENHGRVDFLFAQLSLKGDFEFSCFARVVNYLCAWVSYLAPHSLPVFLMIVEVVLVSEMLSFTRYIS